MVGVLTTCKQTVVSRCGEKLSCERDPHTLAGKTSVASRGKLVSCLDAGRVISGEVLLSSLSSTIPDLACYLAKIGEDFHGSCPERLQIFSATYHH